MATCFITATGTDIGKTYLTAGLIRHFRAQGRAATAFKPILSGFDMQQMEQSDPAQLLAAMERPVTADHIAQISPWRFKAPLSPDMAAAQEGKSISFEALLHSCQTYIKHSHGPSFIEGVGGVMVPLTAQHTVLDWMAALDLPTVLVCGSYLGTLSHTLTAISVLQQRQIPLLAIALNQSPSPQDLGDTALHDVAMVLQRFAPGLPLVTIRRGGTGIEELAALIP